MEGLVLTPAVKTIAKFIVAGIDEAILSARVYCSRLGQREKSRGIGIVS